MLWENWCVRAKIRETTDGEIQSDDDGAPEQMTMTVGGIVSMFNGGGGAFDFYDRARPQTRRSSIGFPCSVPTGTCCFDCLERKGKFLANI